MLKATHTRKARKAWLIGGQEQAETMRTIKTTSTQFFEGRVSISMEFYVLIGDRRRKWFNWIITNLRFLHPRLLPCTIENDTLLTSPDTLSLSLWIFLSSFCFFLSQPCRPNKNLMSIKGNKITHDEYHRFCDKALESKYFFRLLLWSCYTHIFMLLLVLSSIFVETHSHVIFLLGL